MIGSEFYSKGLSDRNSYENTAEKISLITLPYLMRKDGATSSTKMVSSASQSFNGSLLNNLKAKMGMSLLPPSTSSFRLKPDASEMMELFGDNEQAREAVATELAMAMDNINSELENQQIRSDMFDMVLQLIAVGSVVVEKIPNDGIQLHTLKNFVVKLDARGRPLKICIKEVLVFLPDGIEVKKKQEEYELYTMCEYDNDAKNWVVTQDLDGEAVGEEKRYKDYDSLPFRYLGWTWMTGETQHRPFAEDYFADMLQVDKLSMLNTAGAITAAKVLLMVNPRGGRTRKQDVALSSNGDVIDGHADDVTAFQLQKSHDFSVSNEREQEIKKQLLKSFLDTGSVTRDAERVTAEEIRVMAQQLESSTLAGVYSKLSLGWSKWIVQHIMNEINTKFESVEVDVLTGLDSLGRSQEGQKLDSFVNKLASTEKLSWIKDGELIRRWASYDGVNTIGLVKTTEEKRAEAQEQAKQQQEQQMAMSGADAMGQQGGQNLANNITGQPQQ